MSDKKKLKNLDEHNDAPAQIHSNIFSNSPRLNGIACPNCGEELYDSRPMVVLTSLPAKKTFIVQSVNIKTIE